MGTGRQDEDIVFYLNRGGERRAAGLHRAAVQDFAAACHLMPEDDPRLPEVRFIMAMSLLCLEDWQAGWDAYESRFAYSDIARSAVATYREISTLWCGEALAGRSLMVVAEQGLGDALQFCRYILPLIKTGADLYFSCHPPLVHLMQRAFPTVQIIPNTAAVVTDVYIPLLSLPRLLRPQLGAMPYNPGAYLSADPERVDQFRAMIDRLAPGRRCFGLAWSGNPAFADNALRSVPPQLMAALLAVDAVFFTIQPDRDMAPFHDLGVTNLYDLSAELRDFADTAALMTALDGIVSTCTSVVHLAGGLGRPTWVLLHTRSDWRWGLNETTPWYPSLRIARQQVAGDWTLPLLTVARDLVQLAR